MSSDPPPGDSGATPSSSWERSVRRRNVVRLRIGKRMNAQEISEELGWSVSTIRSDLDWLSSQVAKMEEPEMFKKYMAESMLHLMDHESEDLRAADRAEDEKAKHRAKQSMRSSLKLFNEIMGDMETEQESSTDADDISELPEELQDQLSEHAGDEVENVLESE